MRNFQNLACAAMTTMRISDDTAEIWAGGTPVVVQALPLEDHWVEVRFDDGRHGGSR